MPFSVTLICKKTTSVLSLKTDINHTKTLAFIEPIFCFRPRKIFGQHDRKLILRFKHDKQVLNANVYFKYFYLTMVYINFQFLMSTKNFLNIMMPRSFPKTVGNTWFYRLSYLVTNLVLLSGDYFESLPVIKGRNASQLVFLLLTKTIYYLQIITCEIQILVKS